MECRQRHSFFANNFFYARIKIKREQRRENIWGDGFRVILNFRFGSSRHPIFLALIFVNNYDFLCLKTIKMPIFNKIVEKSIYCSESNQKQLYFDFFAKIESYFLSFFYKNIYKKLFGVENSHESVLGKRS